MNSIVESNPIWTDTNAQNHERSHAKEYAQKLSVVVEAWEALGIGEFTQSMLAGDYSRERQGCESCSGIRNFSSGEAMIRAYLVDKATEAPTVGGLRLSRDQLKTLIELPSQELVEAFNRALKAYKRWESAVMYNVSPFVEIQNGRVVILHDQLEQHVKSFEKHLFNEADIELYEDLKTAANLLNSINGRLRDRRLKQVIPGERTYQSDMSLYWSLDVNGAYNIMANNKLLSSFLR